MGATAVDIILLLLPVTCHCTSKHCAATASTCLYESCSRCPGMEAAPRHPQQQQNPAPYLEQIITGHARLAWHSCWDDHEVAALEGGLELGISLETLRQQQLSSACCWLQALVGSAPVKPLTSTLARLLMWLTSAATPLTFATSYRDSWVTAGFICRGKGR
jgi:hypothetical protein